MALGPFRIFTSDWLPTPARLPSEHVVCAIGDVHGQLAHFKILTAWIVKNVYPGRSGRCDLVTLGDYIDRGPESVGVLSFLGAFDPPGVKVTRLIGNHDVFLMKFLFDDATDFDFVEMWWANGGGATLRELGLSSEDFYRDDLAALQARAREHLPPAAAQCLRALQASRRIGDYLFVHGGVHPRRDLADQDIDELVTMREPFLSGAGWAHDFVVVHGHTICGPDVKPHRVACDSGACATGVLTCAQLEEDRMRFVIATESEGPGALDGIAARKNTMALVWTECAAP